MEMGRVSSHGNGMGEVTWEWDVSGHMGIGRHMGICSVKSHGDGTC